MPKVMICGHGGFINLGVSRLNQLFHSVDDEMRILADTETSYHPIVVSAAKREHIVTMDKLEALAKQCENAPMVSNDCRLMKVVPFEVMPVEVPPSYKVHDDNYTKQKRSKWTPPNFGKRGRVKR